jgi:hypothetical protein
VTAPRAVDVGGPDEAAYTAQAFDNLAAYQQLCGGVATLATSDWGGPAFGCAGGSPDLASVRSDLVQQDADEWLASLQHREYERQLAAARARADGTIPWLYAMYGLWVDTGTVNAQAGIGVGHGGYSHTRNPRTGDSDIYLGAGAHTPSLTKSRFGASVTWAPAKPDPNANASGGIVVCAPACIGWQTGMTDGLSFGGGSFVFGYGGGVTDGGAFIDVQHQVR